MVGKTEGAGNVGLLKIQERSLTQMSRGSLAVQAIAFQLIIFFPRAQSTCTSLMIMCTEA